ncbi:hypothetical protein CHLRE_17g701884v5 [Chlamydomonas reinhardtii]|uniref:Uncharacterized protein n=1 Tax=Chlamydomonas reinhardtii TaxID=3055 RepID=A0A2K3CP00_CHLRE|nr:uncharacterized protein CHLRE_17g701884v5 [Chlamydomonas reinhardtii]PNW70009.1 hypothetical protein CHLRE_17g701884v5 [Chlamydomonas reinhardtii]
MEPSSSEEVGLEQGEARKDLDITETVLKKGTLSLSSDEAVIVRFLLALGEKWRRHGREELVRELRRARERGDKLTLFAGIADKLVRLELPPMARPQAMGDEVGDVAPDVEESIMGMVEDNEIVSLSAILELKGACLEEGESGGVEDGRPASSTTAAAAVEGTAVAAPPLNVVTPKEGMADVEAASSGAGAARSGTDVVTDLPEPGVAAGELTDGTLLRELYIALRVPDALRDLLRGNVRQLRPNVLDACNARAKARAALDLEAQSAGRPRTSVELALTVYWDMTGRACLFWIDMTGTDGVFNPVLLVLYVPGPVMQSKYPVLVRAARNMQRRLMEAQTLKKVPRGRLKECGGETHMAGYRHVQTNKASRVTMYAHTSRSHEARVVIGAFGLCIAMLLLAMWDYLVTSAKETVAGTPAILATGAPWGLVPVGLDYFTHPHLDPDDATPTVVFLALWKSATGRRCKDFLDDVERAAHVSRNLFTFGGVSAYTRTQDSDLLVFDARQVVHGADLRVPLNAKFDEAGMPCGVTVGSGVVSRQSDVKVGRAEARGRLELAAEGKTASLHVMCKRGEEFEAEILRMAASAGCEAEAGCHPPSQKRAAGAALPQSAIKGRRAQGSGGKC